MLTSPPKALLLASILFALPFTAAAAAQVGGSSEAFYHINGNSTDQQFGRSVAYLGDLDQDGIDDILVGSPRSDPGGIFNAGSVFVYSGADGSLLRQWDGVHASQEFGSVVAGLQDTNADGIPEVLVGAPESWPNGINYAGSAYMYSGGTGALIREWNGSHVAARFGSSIADAGDINQDGVPDIIIGSEGATVGANLFVGSAFVYSGFTGALLIQHDGVDGSDNFGASVAGVGDINNDGFPDIAVGAIKADLLGGPAAAGVVYTYSGLTGAQIHAWGGSAISEQFGHAVIGVPDIDGDGVNEVVVGAPYATIGGIGEKGIVSIYSGASGVLIRDWLGLVGLGRLGFSLASAGDVDGDGIPDILAGAPYIDSGGVFSTGSVYLFSGGNGTTLHTWSGIQAQDLFGYSVASAGDVSGDGKTDFLFGAALANPGGISDAGSAHVYDFHAFFSSTATEFSAAAGGIVPFAMDFPDAAGGLDYMTLMSISGTGPVTFGVDIPLSSDSFLFDSAVGIYPFPTHTGMHGSLDAQGDSVASITFAPGIASSAVGLTLWFAAVAVPVGQVLPTYSSVAVPILITP